MSNRLDQAREKELQPVRVQYAIDKLKELGIDAQLIGDTKLTFEHLGSQINFFPYSGWASGATIKDGRGIKKLIRQLKKYY